VTSDFPEPVNLMSGTAALPRDNGTLVFRAPWEGRALALAIAVVDRLGVPWDEFRERLIASIAEAPHRPYYDSWAKALERLVIDFGLTSSDALATATPTERLPL
jgi:nitrile hydratase accessory protein